MYRIKTNGEIVSQGELRKIHSGSSLPAIFNHDTLDYLGVDEVFETDYPNTNLTDIAYIDGAEFINNRWQIKWSIKSSFSEFIDDNGVTQTIEMQKYNYYATDVRFKRNELLKNSEWTQVDDTPIDKASWAIYRQKLRDITNQKKFPYGISFPTQP